MGINPMYSVVERKLGKVDVFLPAQQATVITTARKEKTTKSPTKKCYPYNLSKAVDFRDSQILKFRTYGNISSKVVFKFTFQKHKPHVIFNMYCF